MATEHGTRAEAWGTLEELLLACAVSRHGTKRWDSIAMEVQNRTSIFQSLTSQHCIDKFNDLKSRFMPLNDASASFVPIIDELRKIRVEELRREVQRRDDSISSLELKVKKLAEERGRTAEEDTDLVRKRKSSQDTLAGKIAVGEESGDEQENRSFNESNSTDQQKAEAKTAGLQNGAVDGEPSVQPDLQIKNENQPDLSGSNGRTEMDRKESRFKLVHTGGLVDSNELGESKREEKQNSDVQSSASLSLKTKKRRHRGNGGDSGGRSGFGAASSGAEEPECGDEVSPATKREKAAVKSELMIELIGRIWSHRLGSVFRQRLRSQESQRYKNLIRQHIDLQTIQSRLSAGVYSSSIQKFFRDLLLLFNNGVVFFKKNSAENLAACELRAQVLREMANNQEAEAKKKSTLFSKPNKYSSTIVVCGEANSAKPAETIAKKGNSGGNQDKEVEESPKKIEALSPKVEEKNTIRRKGTKDERLDTNKLQYDDVLEMKDGRKGNNNTSKRQGAASFLKRMTQNSPSQVNEDEFSEEQEEKEGVEREGKKGGKNTNTNNNITERVTRSSKGIRNGKDESGRGKKVTIGRGKPPKESPTGKRGRDGGGGGGGKGKKRSRTRS